MVRCHAVSRGASSSSFTRAASGCGGPDPYGPPLNNNGGKPDAPAGSGGNGSDRSAPARGTVLTPMDPSTLPSCGAAVCADSPNAHCVPPTRCRRTSARSSRKCCGRRQLLRARLVHQVGRRRAADLHVAQRRRRRLPERLRAAGQAVRVAPAARRLRRRRALRAVHQPAQQHVVGRLRHRQADRLHSGGGGSGGGGGGTTNTPPPMCPYTGPPLVDVSTLTACGDGAHCVQTALVPAAMASQLARLPSPAGTLCAPDVFIVSAGNYIPKTCASLDAAEGRCLNVVIPQVKAQSAQLTQDICAAYEKCVPCYSPLDGSDTGACKLSCDPGPDEAEGRVPGLLQDEQRRVRQVRAEDGHPDDAAVEPRQGRLHQHRHRPVRADGEPRSEVQADGVHRQRRSSAAATPASACRSASTSASSSSSASRRARATTCTTARPAPTRSPASPRARRGARRSKRT